MKIKVSTIRRIIREELSAMSPHTVRGVAPQHRGGLDPSDVPMPGEEDAPMTMRGLGLGGDEVWDTSDGTDLEDVAPETQSSPHTQRGAGPRRPDAGSMDDVYSDWE